MVTLLFAWLIMKAKPCRKMERGSLKIQDAIDFAVQVGEGLVKVHGKEIVHPRKFVQSLQEGLANYDW